MVSRPSAGRVAVVGCGRWLRGDDQAGLLVAKAIRQAGRGLPEAGYRYTLGATGGLTASADTGSKLPVAPVDRSEPLPEADTSAETTVHTTESPGADLVTLLDGIDLLVVVDAAEQGPTHPPGTWQCIDYRRSPDRVRARSASNAHALGVDLALKLAEQMDLLPTEVWIYAISVAPGGCGEAVSPAVGQTIQFLSERIPSDIEKWRERREEGGA